MRREDIRHYTAGYLTSSRHFVIQNLPARSANYEWNKPLKILLNILQRGCPTPIPNEISAALQISAAERSGREREFPLAGSLPNWQRTIGGAETGFNPASRFFHQWLPEALGPDQSALWLIQPEALISEMIDSVEPRFIDQRVDFYLPEARLVVEIDGSQHERLHQTARDNDRDRLFKQRGIATVRITAAQLANGPARTPVIGALAARIRQEPAVRARLDAAPEADRKTESLVAVFRLQIVLVELMLSRVLDMAASEWTLCLRGDLEENIVRLAFDQVCGLLEPLAALMRLPWAQPALHVTHAAFAAAAGQGVVIDLDVRRRWTDGHAEEPEVVFCRSDYITEVPTASGEWQAVDHFRVECDRRVVYDLREEQDRPHLRVLLKKLFGHDDFRPGQWPILESALRGLPTLGVLPTGGGKSICYQLPVMLQPGVSIAVSPLKSLMSDQVSELSAVGIHRVSAVSGNDAGPTRQRKITDFTRGRLQLLLVSPERLQTAGFRDACTIAARHLGVHYAIVDEVHCVSEWGHQFRTSYLNLGNAFDRFLKGSSFLGLTATASQNALTDIQLEFSVPEDQVFYRLDLKRPNLDFEVVPVSQTYVTTAQQWIDRRMSADLPALRPSGIVFTPHVNGRLGCYPLAVHLEGHLGIPVGCFSGETPKDYVGGSRAYEQEKQQVQERFKSGELRLLCATKAFGMGVNKPDVRFTVHLGMPSSMEALYQEAGRAGRDGAPAQCVVLASGRQPELEAVFDPARAIGPAELRQVVEKSKHHSDLYTHLWMVTKDLPPIAAEVALLHRVLNYLEAVHGEETLLDREHFDVSKDALEKTVHRLAQIGFILDWTVEDFVAGRYLVDFKHRSDDELEQRILHLASVYRGNVNPYTRIEELYPEQGLALQDMSVTAGDSRRRRLLWVFCYWCYRQYTYARLQSLKTVFDLCQKYTQIGGEQFRAELENYFAINSSSIRLRQFLERGFDSIDEWSSLLKAPDSDRDPLREASYFLKLRAMISRLLESYESNAALDFISAAVRLRTGEYEDPDGTGRLRRQLRALADSGHDSARVFDFLLAAGEGAPMRMRECLSRDVLTCFPERLTALRLHAALGDPESAKFYLGCLGTEITQRIQEVEYELSGG